MDSLLDNNQEPTFDESKDYFDDLVGEGKKFKDAKELAKSKILGDLYIKDIVRQKEDLAKSYVQLKAEYDAQAKLVDLVDQIGKERNTGDDTHNVTPTVPVNKSIDEDLDSKLDQLLSKRERANAEKKNLEESKRMLRERLGENYTNVVRSRIDELELSEEDVNALAKRSPKLLARALGIDEPKVDTSNTFQAPPTNQRRNDTFKPVTQKRTWSYYQDLKKTNPRLYIDPKIAVQMHNDHIALGSAFEDGDFHG